MLVERGGQDLIIIFSDINADGKKGSAYWEAVYKFSKTGRKVHNKINASFEFKDGLIIKHTDDFDFWKWSRMALGVTGVLLGWTPILQNQVKSQANGLLDKYIEKRSNLLNNPI